MASISNASRRRWIFAREGERGGYVVSCGFRMFPRESEMRFCAGINGGRMVVVVGEKSEGDIFLGRGGSDCEKSV